MKTLSTLAMLILMIVTSISSFTSFASADFYFSLVFTIVCFLSTSIFITLLNRKNPAFSEQF